MEAGHIDLEYVVDGLSDAGAVEPSALGQEREADHEAGEGPGEWRREWVSIAEGSWLI